MGKFNEVATNFKKIEPKNGYHNPSPKQVSKVVFGIQTFAPRILL